MLNGFEEIAGFVVNYGISNTIMLEIPKFTWKTVRYHYVFTYYIISLH